MHKETQRISRAGLITFGDEDCAHKSFFAHVSMSSLTWSLGRYNVSLVPPCAIPSSSSSSSQPSSRRTLSCNCALPAFSSSAILLPPSASTSAPEPQTEPSKSHSVLESVHSNNEGSSIHGDCFQQRRLLQSVLSVVVAFVMTIGVQGAPSSRDTFEDVPQTLSGEDKGHRIQKPKSAKAETCTRKCVSTCIRGGAGAPGEGPFNVRRPLVVFKEGFRSRNYWYGESFPFRFLYLMYRAMPEEEGIAAIKELTRRAEPDEEAPLWQQCLTTKAIARRKPLPGNVKFWMTENNLDEKSIMPAYAILPAQSDITGIKP